MLQILSSSHKDLEFGGQAAVVLRAASIYPVTSTPYSLLRVGCVDGEEEEQQTSGDIQNGCLQLTWQLSQLCEKQNILCYATFY